MKDTKKIIIIVVAIICGILTIIALLLGNKENNNSNNNSNNNNENYQISKTFTKVNEYEEFFSIQNTINGNLELTTHFNALEMYSNNDSKVNYYFVKGTLSQVLMDDETSSYKSVVYLLIVNNKTKSYLLSTLNNNIIDLEKYANNYNVQYREIDSDKKLVNGTEKIDVILSNYIDYYKNLLFFNPQSAYNMLTNTTKSKYNGYEDFYNNLIEVYESVSSNVYGYNIEEKDDYNIYNINDAKYNKITIIEYGIMDFKIEF